MTRLYWDIVKHIYVVMVWVKYVARVQTNDIYHDVSRWYNQGGFANDIQMRNALGNAKVDGYPGFSFDEVLDTLRDKLLSMKNSSYEGDLIDTIVDILKMPFHANIISGQGLRKLRGALLLPNESAGLIDRIKKAEMACMNCGREFVQEEAVVFSNNGAGTAGLYCMVCMPAQKVKCVSCGDNVDFNVKFSAKKKTPCVLHKKMDAPEVLKDDPRRPVFASQYRAGSSTGSIAAPRPGGGLGDASIFRIRQPEVAPSVLASASPQLGGIFERSPFERDVEQRQREADEHYERLRAQMLEVNMLNAGPQPPPPALRQWGIEEAPPLLNEDLVDEAEPFHGEDDDFDEDGED